MRKKKISILIVEDEAILGENYREGLTDIGYNILDVCNTGESAIKSAREKKPDIILMDIKLKNDMTGIEAYKEINRFMDVPVIYLTAYTDGKIRQEAESTAPVGFINKPVRIEDIHHAIQKGLFMHEL